MLKKSLIAVAGLTVAAASAYSVFQPEPTTSLVNNSRKIFELETHWDQGNVVALVRHAERCDRSDNECLEGNSGITVPGMKEAIEVGKEFEHLPEQTTIIYNSPVKRTDQTAELMFGEATEEQAWLREGCKENLYSDIFKYKQEGKNLILVTHSTCIDRLGELEDNKLVQMDIHDKSTYNSSIFMTVNAQEQEAYVLGYLFADEWDQAFN